MEKPEILLVGGGGHCKSCIDVIEAEGRFAIKGLIDLPEKLGQSLLGYPVIGTDNDLPQLVKQDMNFLITLGHMGHADRRKTLFEVIKSNGGQLPVIIAPSAVVSNHAEIGEGSIVMHQSIVNAGAKIGKNCIVNNKALIEHDAIVGNDCHISTDANVNGDCSIADGVFVGSAATLKNGIRIGKNTIIGAGAVLLKSIDESGVYIGNPAKKLKRK
jgi:sugar O-acyltransferase (sialic acid O-acetyltransferase NeuD family)